MSIFFTQFEWTKWNVKDHSKGAWEKVLKKHCRLISKVNISTNKTHFGKQMVRRRKKKKARRRAKRERERQRERGGGGRIQTHWKLLIPFNTLGPSKPNTAATSNLPKYCPLDASTWRSNFAFVSYPSVSQKHIISFNPSDIARLASVARDLKNGVFEWVLGFIRILWTRACQNCCSGKPYRKK